MSLQSPRDFRGSRQAGTTVTRGPRRANGRRQTRDPERTREAILAAAETEFAAKGLSGARVDAIARRARANKRMIYHYFGSKDRLYAAVLERVYAARRGSERTLDLAHLDPQAAIRALVEFNFAYAEAHPEFIRLVNNENLYGARHLRGSNRVRALHSPLLEMIADILRRGAEQGVFRRDVDPVQLYISIAGLGYFYLSNNATLSAVFGRDLSTPMEKSKRRQHMVDVILGYLRP